MLAGKLDRRITLQRATNVQNELGENVPTWGNLGPASIAASYQPVSDGEKLAAGEVGSTLSARFTIRFDTTWADVSTLDRIVFEGRTFDIWGVKEITRRAGFEITAAARSE